MKIKKKQRNILIGIVLLALAILIIFQGNLFSLSVGDTPNLCSGGQVLSISNAQITTSDSPDLGKKVIRATFSTIPTAECLRVRLSASDLEQKIDNFDAKNDVFVDIKLVSQEKIFNINQNTKKFNKLVVKNIGNRAFCTDNACQDNGVNNVVASLFKTSVGGDCYCIAEDQRGFGGDIQSSSQIQWKTDIKVGSNQKLTLTNNQLSGKLGNIAFVKWAGNLVGNDGISRPNRDAYKPFSDNQFRIVDAGVYNLLNTQFSNILSSSDSADNGGVAVCGSCIDNANSYNSLFDTETRAGQDMEWAQSEANVKEARVIGNQLDAFLISPVAYPTFTLDIVAEEVGIFITSGEPDVTCPSNFNIVSGETKNVQLSVKNKGTNSGAFAYSLNCNKGSQVVQPSPPQSVQSGSTLSVMGTFGLTVISGTETASCTFTAKDINNLKEDSCTFGYTSEHQSQCIKGTNSCELGNKQLWTCLDDGTYSKVDCQFGCEGFENTYRCRLQGKEVCDDGIDNDGNGLTDEKDPQCIGGGSIFDKIGDFFKKLFSGFFGTLLTIKYILIAIVSLVTLFFTREYSIRFKDLKKKNGARWIVSLIMAGLVGYLAYVFIGSFLFWVITIGIVLFKVTVGGYLPNFKK